MVNFINGNIVNEFNKGTYDALGHVMGCFHDWSRDTSIQIRNVYPGLYSVDMGTINKEKSKLGTYSKLILPNGKELYNMYILHVPILGINEEVISFAPLEDLLTMINVELEGKNLLVTDIHYADEVMISKILTTYAPNVRFTICQE